MERNPSYVIPELDNELLEEEEEDQETEFDEESITKKMGDT